MGRSMWWSRTTLLAGASCLLMAGAANAQDAHPKGAGGA
ncbi:MAG: hypothetical protein K0Q62_560, partial [Phenylobacterium sp.]|nr:hypothetical protein [Phenylobacterium sp.]